MILMRQMVKMRLYSDVSIMLHSVALLSKVK